MKIKVAITPVDFRFGHGVDEVVIPHTINSITMIELMVKAITEDTEEELIYPFVFKQLQVLKKHLGEYAVKRAAEGWPVEGVVAVSPWETHEEAFNRRCAALRTNWDKVKLEDVMSSDETVRNEQALRLLGLR